MARLRVRLAQDATLKENVKGGNALPLWRVARNVGYQFGAQLVQFLSQFLSPPHNLLSRLHPQKWRLISTSRDASPSLRAQLGMVVFVARYDLTLMFWGGLGWLTWRGVRRSLLRSGRSL